MKFHETKVLRFEENKRGRDFIVGDLHGCFSYLLKLCEHIRFDPEHGDRLFCVGDLVDRGPESFRTLKIIDYPWCHSVIGNHEEFIYRMGTDDPSSNNYITAMFGCRRNGGDWFFELADEIGSFYNELAQSLVDLYLKKMPLMIVVGEGAHRYNIVHADLYRSRGLISDWDIDNWAFTPEEEYNMIWGRTVIRMQAGNPDYQPLHHDLSKTYCGHTPVNVVTVAERQWFIDTGAVHAKPTHPDRGLTIVDHKEQKYHTYQPIYDRIVTYTLPPF